MVNSTEFTKRLEKIFEYYDLSASSFADKIEVGRSSISHIVSGRNKPSLDFVMKVVSTFDEVDLYWLLNGKGTFPKSDTTVQSSTPPRPQSSFSDFDTSPTQDLFSDAEHHSNSIENHIAPKPSNVKSKAIAKIIVLYTDGSFEAFEN